MHIQDGGLASWTALAFLIYAIYHISLHTLVLRTGSPPVMVWYSWVSGFPGWINSSKIATMDWMIAWCFGRSALDGEVMKDVQRKCWQAVSCPCPGVQNECFEPKGNTQTQSGYAEARLFPWSRHPVIDVLRHMSKLSS